MAPAGADEVDVPCSTAHRDGLDRPRNRTELPGAQRRGPAAYADVRHVYRVRYVSLVSAAPTATYLDARDQWMTEQFLPEAEQDGA
ncbi:hypothetical protein ACWCQS_23615 [Streptomyces sp. NPDC002076]